jgi:hypothetical protein
MSRVTVVLPAGGADQGGQTALGDGEVDVFQGGFVLPVVGERDVLEADVEGRRGAAALGHR